MSVKEEIMDIEKQISKLKEIRKELEIEIKKFDEMLEKYEERND